MTKIVKLLDPLWDLSKMFVTAKSLQSLYIQPLSNYNEHAVYSILKGGTNTKELYIYPYY